MADDHKPPAIVLHIPHASMEIPDDVRQSFVVDDAQLRLELLRMTDHFTDELFRVPPAVATSAVYPVSRLVCDPERFPDDAEETMAARGMGVIYTQRHDLGPLRKAGMPVIGLTHDGTHYFDYHHTVDDTLDKINRDDLNQSVAAYTTAAFVAANIEQDFGRLPLIDKITTCAAEDDK